MGHRLWLGYRAVRRFVWEFAVSLVWLVAALVILMVVVRMIGWG